MNQHPAMQNEHALPPALSRCAAQDTVFAPQPNRLALMQLEVTWPLAPLKLTIHRNTTVEFIESALIPYLAYAGYEPFFSIGGYDDSLSLSGDLETELHIIWLDFGRYDSLIQDGSFLPWLEERLLTLRGMSTAPILLCNTPTNTSLNKELAGLEKKVSDMRVFDLHSVLTPLGDKAFDQRMLALGATGFSAKAVLVMAQNLGMKWIPSAIAPRLKAIVVDLDNTLYSGILGEDSSEGLELTGAYRLLQEKLFDLKKQGLFLAVLSKNEAADVEGLFQTRQDFPLGIGDFSAKAISWNSKAEGMTDIARALRIGTDAILFIDDNMGELNAVSHAFPDVKLLHASDPELVNRALDFYPGLMSWIDTRENTLRSADLAANARREEAMKKEGDPLAYLKSLETKLVFGLNRTKDARRLYDLSQKTNQFNLALKRFQLADVERYLQQSDKLVVTVALSDKLSDSGIIASLMLGTEGDRLIVDELCISCRALGRGLEDYMIFRSISLAAEMAGLSRVGFAYSTAPRNGPARRWLEQSSGQTLKEKGLITMDVPDTPELPITAEIKV